MSQPKLTEEAIGIKAKEHFLKILLQEYQNHEELFVHCLLEFVKNNEKLHNIYTQSMIAATNQIESLKKSLGKIYLYAITDLAYYENLFPLLKTAHEKYKLMDSETLRSVLQQNEMACFNAFHSVLEEISPLLSKIQNFSELNNEFNESLENYETKCKATLLTDNYYKPYKDAVIEPEYYLSDKELELAAHLFDKKVILFSDDQEPQVLNEKGKSTVFIKHEGNDKFGHYSRLVKG